MESSPHAVMVAGLPGSGKTYFAKRLAPALGARYLGSDRLRKEMFAERTYSADEKAAVYERLKEVLVDLLRQGQSVVVDATFCAVETREELLVAALTAGARPSWVRVTAPEHVIRQRLALTREDSEADWSVYLKLRDACQPFQGEYLALESTEPVETLVATAIAYLHSRP